MKCVLEECVKNMNVDLKQEKGTKSADTLYNKRYIDIINGTFITPSEDMLSMYK